MSQSLLLIQLSLKSKSLTHLKLDQRLMTISVLSWRDKKSKTSRTPVTLLMRTAATQTINAPGASLLLLNQLATQLRTQKLFHHQFSLAITLEKLRLLK